MTIRVKEILVHIHQLADPVRATHSLRFFKTGVGEYGEGDQFLGLTNPQIRDTVRRYWKGTTLNDAIKLINSPLHEVRLTGLLILVEQFQHGIDQEQIYKLYLENTAYVNNWDLVDLTAHKIVGNYLLDRPRDILYQLAKSKNLWERRISIISTFAFIAQNDLADAIKLSTLLLHDSHDLIHKAVGWVLREVGKKDLPTLVKFLDTHAPAMPRTMLRYAIEKLNTTIRTHYLSQRIS